MKKQISVHLFYLMAIAGIFFGQNRERQKLLSQIETEFSPTVNAAIRLLDWGQRAYSRDFKATANVYRTANNQSILPKIELLAEYSTECKKLAEAETTGEGLDWHFLIEKASKIADSTIWIAGNNPDFLQKANFKKLIGTELLIKSKAAKTLVLLALQTDIFTANNAIVGKVDAYGDIRLDQWEPLIQLINDSPKVGEKCTASIFLIPNPTTFFNPNKVEIEVNGQKIPQINGLGLFETKFSKAGKNSIKAVVKMIDPITGEVKNYWKEQVIDVLP